VSAFQFTASRFVLRKYFPHASMDLIGARLDARVHHGASRVSEFRAVIAGLQIEFSQCIRRRPHDNAGTIEEVNQVRIVVNAIQNEIVLFRALTVCHKIA